MKLFFPVLALLAPLTAPQAWAAEGVTLTSQTFVEKTETGPAGQPVTVRKEPGIVTPGDKVVFVLSYHNGGARPATGFVLTNPVPDAITYAGSDDAAAVVSVDGGKTWGPLAAQKVRLPDGTSRPAAAADVTHVRWPFAQAVAAGGSGRVSYRGVVK
ncbi:MAG: hypothetical protein QM676_07685 [Novosphingobium sp.]